MGREYKYGYISRGDVVEIDFMGDRAVGESELLRLRIIPSTE